MCFGGSKSSTPQVQKPPAPNPATTFDYSTPNRSDAQRRADGAVNSANTATVLSSTMGGGQFGSELGGAAPQPAA